MCLSIGFLLSFKFIGITPLCKESHKEVESHPTVKEGFSSKIKILKKKAKLEDNLKKLKINIKERSNEILKGINPLRLGNNPIPINNKDIYNILMKIN